MTRHIIIDEKRGIFLGVYLNYAVFAKNDPIGSFKAFSFKTLEEAEKYVAANMPSIKDGVKYGKVSSDSDFVHVVDIIKAGYGDDAFEMMNYMPMTSEMYH